MRRLILLIAGLAFAVPAAAKGVGYADVLHWGWEPWVLACLAVATIPYLIGLYRMDRDTRRSIVFRAVAFLAGIEVLVIALEPPVDSIAGSLTSAQMFQHLLLLWIAPPLLVAGRPAFVWLRAIDAGPGRSVVRGFNRCGLAALFNLLKRPLVAWLLLVATLCFWHLPGPYDWGAHHGWLHDIESLSFLGFALCYWTVVIGVPGRRRALGYGMTMVYVVSIGFAMGMISAILTLASHPLYAVHLNTTQSFGLTPLQDQQLAGAIMWIPSNMIHLATICTLFFAWMREDERRAPKVQSVLYSSALRCAVIVPLVLIGLSACGGGNNDNGNDQSNGITTIQLNNQGGNNSNATSNVSTSVNSSIGPKSAEPWETIPGANPQHGAALIRHYGCGGCHTIPGIGNADGIVGPPLTKWSQRMIIAGFMRNRPSNLIPWIQNPQSILPGVDMPNMGITRKQARDIAAYLYTLD